MDSFSLDVDNFDDLLKRYYRARLLTDVAGGLQERFLPSKSQELDLNLKRADLAYKKRLLGMPQTDDDFEHASNDGLDFKNSGVMSVFGKYASDSLPSLRHFSDTGSSPLLKTAISAEAPSVGKFLSRVVRRGR